MYSAPSRALRRVLHVIGLALFRLGLARRIIALRKRSLRVLLYHAVEDQETPFTAGLSVSVSKAMFDANLSYFKDYYNVVDVSDIYSSALPDNALAITIDDGYRSVYENALPLLSKHQLPACVYLNTCAVEGRLIWVNELSWALVTHPKEALAICHQFPGLSDTDSRLEIIDRIKREFAPAEIRELRKRLQEAIAVVDNHKLYADEAELEEMKQSGIKLGFHTRDHYNLTNCDKGELANQLDSSSLKGLIDPSSFAYPFGEFNDQSIALMDASDYSNVMTVGCNNDRFSNKHVDRLEVFSDDPAVVFAKIELEEAVVAAIRRLKFKLRSIFDSKANSGVNTTQSVDRRAGAAHD